MTNPIYRTEAHKALLHFHTKTSWVRFLVSGGPYDFTVTVEASDDGETYRDHSTLWLGYRGWKDLENSSDSQKWRFFADLMGISYWNEALTADLTNK